MFRFRRLVVQRFRPNSRQRLVRVLGSTMLDGLRPESSVKSKERVDTMGIRGGAVAVLAWVALVPATLHAEKQSHYDLVQKSIDGYVVPRLAAFQSATRSLAGSVSAYCSAPGEAGRADVVARFREALTAWAEAEVVRTGPATRDGRAQKIAFWPDPRGAVERQLRDVLAHRKTEMETPETLRGQSAAVQGFPALEIILADKTVDLGGSDEDGRYRCRAATAIARNIAALADEIHDGWVRSSGWREHMLRPGSDNADYPSAGAAATDLFKSLTTSLQAIIEGQLQPLAGKDKDKRPKASAIAYRRLGLSRDYLLAGVEGCHAFYKAADLASYLDASDGEQKLLQDSIETAFAQTEHDIASEAWARAGSGSNGQMIARAAASMLGAARRIIATKVAEAAEVSLGFNELDGD